MSKASIAHCIKNARLTRGLTQQQVADALAVTQQSIDLYERAVINIPSLRLEQLATFFSIPAGEFYTYECPCLTLVGATPGEETAHA